MQIRMARVHLHFTLHRGLQVGFLFALSELNMKMTDRSWSNPICWGTQLQEALWPGRPRQRERWAPLCLL